MDDDERPDTAIGAKVLVAWALAATAGFVDAIGYRTLEHLFTAHMSGNSARLGVFLGRFDLHAAIPMVAAVGLFVFGIGTATAVAEFASRHFTRATMPLLLGIQALLLAVFLGYGMQVIGADGQVVDHSLRGFYALAALAIVSIGFQICALQHAGGQHTRTTYVSGMLTRFAQEATNWLFWLHDGSRRPKHSYLGAVLASRHRAEAAAHARLSGGIWCLYLGGATAGSYLDGRWRLWSLAFPIGVLVAIILIDRWQPFRPR